MSKTEPPVGIGSMEWLGPLPEPGLKAPAWLRVKHGLQTGAGWFTPEQIRAYALQERAAERERCAKLCEAEADNWRGLQDISDFKLCAARIRAGA